ncbi:hypothetical protein Hamer_G003990 [Homarus americanus]|uniref:Uncharacterized protein n=1 Tax=Homarus americanus TaxID=6706 RepID=A0A8J5NEI7_HOMAM|nr:hypothetical protein Hamer_G003990 [Homarus americanus]
MTTPSQPQCDVHPPQPQVQCDHTSPQPQVQCDLHLHHNYRYSVDPHLHHNHRYMCNIHSLIHKYSVTYTFTITTGTVRPTPLQPQAQCDLHLHHNHRYSVTYTFTNHRYSVTYTFTITTELPNAILELTCERGNTVGDSAATPTHQQLDEENSWTDKQTRTMDYQLGLERVDLCWYQRGVGYQLVYVPSSYLMRVAQACPKVKLLNLVGPPCLAQVVQACHACRS